MSMSKVIANKIPLHIMSKPIEVEVCIIGGGVSGLKAAHTLLNYSESKYSSKDLILLEAQDRLGGRIFTDRTSSKLGLSYDLGASWFHDSLNNVVLEESINDGSFNVMEDGYYDDKDMKVFASDKDGPLDVNDMRLHRVAEDLEKFIELYYFDDLDKKDMPLYKIVGMFMEKHSSRLTTEQKKYCNTMLRYLELWYGITWDKISAKYSIMDHQGRNLFNKKGYDFVINKLSRDIPEDRILLAHPVTSIIRNNKNGDKKVAVESANGPTVYCNYLIVTVPQSILSLSPLHIHGITWTPPLPSNITNALESIHFGALGKVIFEFDSCWWDINEDRFEILADSTDDSLLSESLKLPPKSFSFPVFAVNYAAVHKNSTKGASLCILTQSPLTDYLESHPDQAWSYFKPMLAKLKFSDHEVSDPINTITSNWTNNPYVRGSYSAVESGDDPLDIITQLSGEHDCGLTDKNIRFAGEHTILDGSGCVHGAYMSGQREAIWILKDSGAISTAE
ncbi:unnamed protein product [Debaryomyces fabryi]|nr:unnamed protein product [Debaryomyces fabryi]